MTCGSLEGGLCRRSLTLRNGPAALSPQPHPEERSVSKGQASPESTGSSFETQPDGCSSGGGRRKGPIGDGPALVGRCPARRLVLFRVRNAACGYKGGSIRAYSSLLDKEGEPSGSDISSNALAGARPRHADDAETTLYRATSLQAQKWIQNGRINAAVQVLPHCSDSKKKWRARKDSNL